MEKVCRIAVEAEADESLLPEDWLMTYRWNKGKGKGAGMLPNGHKLAFETVLKKKECGYGKERLTVFFCWDVQQVGGRTSAFAPALQKLRKSSTIKKTTIRKRRIDGDDEATIKTENTSKRTKETRTTVIKGKKKVGDKVGVNAVKTEPIDTIPRRTSSRVTRSTNSLA